jgi:transposase-like protein
MTYKDKEKLQKLYHNRMLSSAEISEKFDVSQKTIRYWMDKFDIERRSRKEGAAIRHRKTPPKMGMDSDGHEIFQLRIEGSRVTVSHHRLLAAVEHDLDVLDKMVVHHDTFIPWDNRPDNLTLMDHGDHVAYHRQVERETQFLAQTLGIA